MKYCKRFFCILLSLVLFVCSSVSVYANVDSGIEYNAKFASQYDEWFGEGNWDVDPINGKVYAKFSTGQLAPPSSKFLDFLTASMACSPEFLDLNGIMEAFNLNELINGLFSSDDISINDNDGSVEVSPEAQQNIYNIMNNYISEKNGFVHYIPNSDLNSLIKALLTYGPFSSDIVSDLTELYNRYDVCLWTLNEQNTFYVCFLPYDYYYRNDSAGTDCSSINNSSSVYNVYFSNGSFTSSNIHNSATRNNIIGYDHVAKGVFNLYDNYSSAYLASIGDSQAEIISYLRQIADNTKPIVMPIEVIDSTDWTQQAQDAYNAISAYFGSQEGMSEDDKQTYINDYFKELIETLKNQNTPTPIPTITPVPSITVTPTPGGGGSDDSGILEKIYNKVSDILAFLQWQNFIDGITGFMDSLTSIFDSLLIEPIKNLLQGFMDSLNGLVVDLLGDLLTDVFDFFVGEGGDISDIVSNSSRNLATASKTKFPTSIPWDFMAVVTVFASEPQAPYFDIPIQVSTAGIDEHIIIDFEKYAELAELCRAFSTVIFIFYLLVQTRKLYGATLGK